MKVKVGLISEINKVERRHKKKRKWEKVPLGERFKFNGRLKGPFPIGGAALYISGSKGLQSSKELTLLLLLLIPPPAGLGPP